MLRFDNAISEHISYTFVAMYTKSYVIRNDGGDATHGEDVMLASSGTLISSNDGVNDDGEYVVIQSLSIVHSKSILSLIDYKNIIIENKTYQARLTREENRMETEQRADKRLKSQPGEKFDKVISQNIIIYDYDVINIIFYRDVLKKKLLYLRKQFINYGIQYINYIRPLTQLKLSTEHIKEFKPNQNFRLLHLYNSNMLIEVQKLLHLNKSMAFKFCKTLVTSSLTMLCDINLIENLIDNNFQEKGRIVYK
ncbi:Uncharacterized protein FWK35_00029245, partial [Aphis craccivora]